MYGNLKSDNSQDYAQKPQRNCSFINSTSGQIFVKDDVNGFSGGQSPIGSSLAPLYPITHQRLGKPLSLRDRSLHTVPKIQLMCSQNRNYDASVPIPTFKCLWAFYIFPGSVHILGCSKTDRPILEIYKSLTDIWVYRNWETEHYNSVLEITRLHSLISGNT